MSTIICNGAGEPLLYVPDYFKGRATQLLQYVNAATTTDQATRIRICRREPMIFALVYLRHHMSSEETGNKRSINPLHIFLAEHAATYWPFPLKPKECRVCVVAPRDSGKTTWNYLILPLWGGAYGWRVFQLFLSSSGDTAKEHLASLKDELRSNARLRADFPDLCEPERHKGRPTGDNTEVFRSASGVTFMAKGIDAKNLGRKEKRTRPDLIVIDDIEPLGKYSNDARTERLNLITRAILPMNLNAAVYIVGTVVRYGAIMHDVVKAATGGGVADWIRDEEFQTKYWPVYGINSQTRTEESFWPERYSLKWIKSQLHIDSFQLSHMNQPVTGGDGLFSKRDLHFGAPFVVHSYVMTIDPAVSVGDKSDFTGISVIGFDAADMNAFVEYAKGVKVDPERLRELVRLLLEHYPKIGTVLIETINGGLYVVDAIKPVMPKHVRLEVRNEYAPKASRIRQLHDYSQRRWVFLNTGLNEYVDQALSYPVVEHDDVIDSVAKGVHYKLEKRPIPLAG